jgi:uncharacterized protein YecA (UPF0149 family)
MNRLCEAFQDFFAHVDERMQQLARDWKAQQATLEAEFHANQARSRSARDPKTKAAPGRNDPCPCGSGRKFKRCCGR